MSELREREKYRIKRRSYLKRVNANCVSTTRTLGLPGHVETLDATRDDGESTIFFFTLAGQYRHWPGGMPEGAAAVLRTSESFVEKQYLQ